MHWKYSPLRGIYLLETSVRYITLNNVIMSVCENHAALLTQQVDAYGNNNTSITTIDSEDFYEDDMFPRMAIEVPVELLQIFANNETGLVRTVSFVYYAIDELFPGGLPGDNR